LKGILITPDNIKATMEGRKTQTRRLIKFPHIDDFNLGWSYDKSLDNAHHFFYGVGHDTWLKPRYLPGEVVYLKESHYAYGSWHQEGFNDSGSPNWVFEQSEYIPIYFEDEAKPIDPEFKVLRGHHGLGWYKRSPLFMPAIYARTFLLIESVRPERLQDITMEDARAEGILTFDADHPDPTNGGVCYNRGAPGLPMRYESTAAYMDLWDSINPKHPWKDNDWVFVYTYKVVPKTA
jgi:hypothetical protein